MLTHRAVWLALDQIARRNDMSVSALAKSAGLDPTTFNRSKRVTRDGRQRWPGTESIAKVLAATETSLAEFVDQVDRVSGGGGLQTSTLPVTTVGDAARSDMFDNEGQPIGDGWQRLDLPTLLSHGNFMLEVDDNSAAPVFRNGDLLMISVDSGVRRDDRVAVARRDGPVVLRELLRRTVNAIEVRPFGGGEVETSHPRDIVWLGRIVCILPYN